MLLEGLAFRRLRVAAQDVVFVKGVIDASEGLAVVFAESGGELTLATSLSQAGLLDEIIADLTREVGALLEGS
jgi:hypothetical protein